MVARLGHAGLRLRFLGRRRCLRGQRELGSGDTSLAWGSAAMVGCFGDDGPVLAEGETEAGEGALSVAANPLSPREFLPSSSPAEGGSAPRLRSGGGRSPSPGPACPPAPCRHVGWSIPGLSPPAPHDPSKIQRAWGRRTPWRWGGKPGRRRGLPEACWQGWDGARGQRETWLRGKSETSPQTCPQELTPLTAPKGAHGPRVGSHQPQALGAEPPPVCESLILREDHAGGCRWPQELKKKTFFWGGHLRYRH